MISVLHIIIVSSQTTREGRDAAHRCSGLFIRHDDHWFLNFENDTPRVDDIMRQYCTSGRGHA